MKRQNTLKKTASFTLFAILIGTTVALTQLQTAFAEQIIFESKFGKFGVANGSFNSPQGITVGPDGTVYVVDTMNNQIQRFSSNGTFIQKWGGYFGGGTQFNNPTAIATDKNGTLYVADTLYHRIQKFSADGTYIGKIGSYGSLNGKLRLPEGVAVDSRGNVFVADTGNNRIEKFSAQGKFIAAWGKYGVSNGNFNLPEGIAMGPDDSVYVADTGNNRIQKFMNNGTFLSKWGAHGSDVSKFNHPEGIAVSNDGTVFVADTMNHRIQAYSNNGTYLSRWGQIGQNDGEFDMPRSISVTAQGLYVLDSNNNRVQEFLNIAALVGGYPAIMEEIMVNGTSYSLEIKTHSGISDFGIDEASKNIEFKIDKTDAQYPAIFIPVGDFLGGPYTVLIDGSEATDAAMPITDYSTGKAGLMIRYEGQEEHSIVISGTQVIPEFSPLLILLTLLATFGLLLSRRMYLQTFIHH